MNAGELNFELQNLKDHQARVNGKLELMPPSPKKNYFLGKRTEARIIYNKQILPLKKQLSTLDEAYGGGMAQRMIDNIEALILHANMLETKILSDIEQSNVQPVQGAHPFAGLGDQAQDDADTSRGMTAMKMFFDRASSYSDNGLPQTWEEFISFVNEKNPYLFIGLGGAINSIDQDTGLSDSKIQSQMETLADKGQGRLPVFTDGTNRTNWNVFFNAVKHSAEDLSYWDALSFTAVETAKDITEGVVTEGQNLLQSTKLLATMSKYLPWIALAGGAFYIFTKAGGIRQVMKK